MNFETDVFFCPLTDTLAFFIKINAFLFTEFRRVTHPHIQIAGFTVSDSADAAHYKNSVNRWLAREHIVIEFKTACKDAGDLQNRFFRRVITNSARGLMGNIARQHWMVDMKQERKQREKLLLPFRQRSTGALKTLLI